MRSPWFALSSGGALLNDRRHGFEYHGQVLRERSGEHGPVEGSVKFIKVVNEDMPLVRVDGGEHWVVLGGAKGQAQAWLVMAVTIMGIALYACIITCLVLKTSSPTLPRSYDLASHNRRCRNHPRLERPGGSNTWRLSDTQPWLPARPRVV